MTLSDESIKKQVVDDLYWDSSIDASKVAVTVENGNVTLAGTVPSFSARTRAVESACRIADVRWVDNRLVVRYPPSVPVPTDADIREAVLHAFSTDPEMDTTNIRVSVISCTVTLDGSVDEYWKRSSAEWIAGRVRGVCNVINKLTVVPTRNVADKAIAGDVEAALERNSLVTTDTITISVENGVVTLSGTVPDWLVRQAAIGSAEYTRGVVNVVNNLAVGQS